ncbi:MAG: iron ABC transporter substrate-binding protein [Actinomycetota bacterium]|nr:iron ABC transporter substrate-binding protein [Actinomycetota bacterium]
MRQGTFAAGTGRPTRARIGLVLPLLLLATALVACSGDGDRLTLYSGRAEVQVKPILEEFTRATGIEVSARYGASAELAAQIAEEGSGSRADVFWAQDAGALGAVDKLGLLATIPPGAAAAVDERFRAPDDAWTGVSGRARVITYDPRKVPPAELPASVFALTEPKWKGRIAIAPTNGSFQSFVTAMLIATGEGRTRAWLDGIRANDPKTYASNDLIVKAVNDGQVDLGLVNHYYLFQLQSEIGQERTVARNHYTAGTDPGALVNVSGVGILKSSKRQADAARLVEYLLSEPAQRHFALVNFEYPLLEGVPTAPGLPPLQTTQGPPINLGDLANLEHTLDLLRDASLL